MARRQAHGHPLHQRGHTRATTLSGTAGMLRGLDIVVVIGKGGRPFLFIDVSAQT